MNQDALPLSAFNRLRPEDVERLHRLLAGDPYTEGAILHFIAAKYGARNLFYLPPKVAAAILARPTDFIRAAKNYYQPRTF